MEAIYESRIKECKTQDELAEYLLKCIPTLIIYTGINTNEDKQHNLAGMHLSSKQGIQRRDVYKKYMKEVEDEAIESEISIDPYTQPCRGCGKVATKYLDEILSDVICINCGLAEFVQGDEIGFKEEQEIEKNIVYSYKRENHFNEWISQFQAKESTSVPEEVIGQLRTEFKKQKIKNLNEITHEKVKSLLKKLDKSKYYEHVPYIATILSGITPPMMPQELEDRLRLMFHTIQESFEKNKPKNRKNFLSYSFVLYKFCELLGEDQYLPCFPLLKSKEKLYIQDVIWKSICKDLDWEFIHTTNC
jgi:hypothetical protein